MMSVFLDEVDSTNEEAKRRAMAGEIGPLWIGAASQTHGRGRRGRNWVSQTGNLFATGLFSLENGVGSANISFVAALAVAEVLECWVDASKIALKWPNDVLIEGNKTSGILLESWLNNGLFQLAVGIGINIINAPDDTERRATSISKHIKENIDCPSPKLVMRHLMVAFERNLAILTTQGFSEIRKQWLKRAQGLGKAIIARTHDKEICGIFEFLGENGELLLRDNEKKLHQISAGDVFLL